MQCDTFATMHYAHFRSAAETAAELGHGASLRMMQRHYLNRVTPAQAQAFWQMGTRQIRVIFFKDSNLIRCSGY